jgi:hypothetical protein
LIVASSYGLELTHALQADLPLFRSAYQSSIFLATRLALLNESPNVGGADLRQKTRDAVDRWFPQANPHARVFEIGRSQIQSLQTGDQSLVRDGEPGAEQCDANILNCSSIDLVVAHVFPEMKSGSLMPLGFLAAILLGIALMTSARLRKVCFPRETLPNSWYLGVRPRTGWLVVLLGAVILVGLGLSVSWSYVADALTGNGLGEPILFLRGLASGRRCCCGLSVSDWECG